MARCAHGYISLKKNRKVPSIFLKFRYAICQCYSHFVDLHGFLKYFEKLKNTQFCTSQKKFRRSARAKSVHVKNFFGNIRPLHGNCTGCKYRKITLNSQRDRGGKNPWNKKMYLLEKIFHDCRNYLNSCQYFQKILRLSTEDLN